MMAYLPYLLIAGGLLLVAVVTYDKWGGGLGSLFTFARKTGGDTISEKDEFKDVQALHRLENRFVKTKCKDGQAAMAVVATHFFHREGEHG